MPLRDHRIFNRGRQTRREERREQMRDNIQNLFDKNVFDTAVVTEFISDPDFFLSIPVEVDETSISSGHRSKVKGSDKTRMSTMLEEITTGTKKVENAYLARIMPKNSIIAYNITDGKNLTNNDPEIFFPFFPAHIGMPVKSGEQVWVFYEKIGKKKVGYWLFRKTATIHADDLNYTFLDRQVPIAGLLNTKNEPNTNLNKSKFKTLVKNLAYKFEDYRTGGDGSGTLKIDPDSIVIDSLSYTGEFVGEAVPRYNKKCGDLVLQGSNNTLITMTHEDEPGSGTISLVVGRFLSENETDSEMIVKNTRGDSAKSLEHDELDKTKLLHSDTGVVDEGSIENFAASSARIDMGMMNGGSILAHAANGSFLKMDSGDISISRTIDFDYSNSQITLIDDQIGIEAPSIVSIRAPDGEIKLAFTGDTENPTTAADILMNDGDQPYVRYEELRSLLNDIVDDLAYLNSFTQIFTNPNTTAIAALPGGAAALVVIEPLAAVLSGLVVAGAPSAPTSFFPKINAAAATYTEAVGKIGTANQSGLRGTMASSRIFGS